ncbi:MAG TPA: DUF308 domain-containing protein [Polyangiaceae bacterium]
MIAAPSSFLAPVESHDHPSGWAMVLRGVIAVVFGVIVMRSPGLAAAAFVIVFAVYAFVDAGMDFFVAARRGRAGLKWGWYLFEGIVSVALGVLALALPGMTILLAVLLIGIRALVLGILELAAAFSSRAIVESRWLIGLAGAVSILFGILLLARPTAGAVAVLWMVGAYALVFGVVLFALGLRMLWTGHEEHHVQHPAATAG